MIVDWTTHVKKIEKTHKLAESDEFDKKHMYKQELVYIRYLISKGLNYEQIRAEWIKIKNGTAQKIGDDEEELDIQFGSMYRRVDSRAYKFYDTMPKLEKIQIYQEEIDYLNSLDLLKWEKEYWMALLVYYKFVSQVSKKVDYDMILRNWALDVTCVSKKVRKYYDIWETLGKDRNKTGKNIIQLYTPKFNDKCATYFPCFIKLAGSNPTSLKTINTRQLGKIFKKLEGKHRICPRCGKKFEITNKNQTDLCSECWKKQKANKVSKLQTQKYHLRENPARVCTCCGQEYTTSPQSKRTICDDCYRKARSQSEKERLHKVYLKTKENKIHAGVLPPKPPLL